MTEKPDGQSEADKALAEAREAEKSVEAMRARFEPVLDSIAMHVDDNAILKAFRSTIRIRRPA